MAFAAMTAPLLAGRFAGELKFGAVVASRFLEALNCPTCCITEPNNEVRPVNGARLRPDAFGVRVQLVLFVLLLLPLLLVLLLLLLLVALRAALSKRETSCVLHTIVDKDSAEAGADENKEREVDED